MEKRSEVRKMNIASNDKESVLEAIRSGEIDAADVAFPNLIDEIMLKMRQLGLLGDLAQALPDKRKANAAIPHEIVLFLMIAAKMKTRASLSDVPFAVTDPAALSEIGWNIWDNERGLREGLMTEGALRNIVGKYDAASLVASYNTFVQGHAFGRMGIEPDIHILDCTKLAVPLGNGNYEESDVASDGKGKTRGYKLATLRGVHGDTGVIEEIRFGKISTHDLKLSDEMVRGSAALKPGDILINDRGFISRDLLNHMKKERGVDTYIPLKCNMEAFEQAVSLAKENGKWHAHPSRKRKTQEIAFVSALGPHWRSDKPEEDAGFNACVVRDSAKDRDAGDGEADDGEYKYRVFISTDLGISARQIIKTYEIRPEIEEDYRQIKDFWKIEEFTSTKHAFIVFHAIMVLIGYLFFQLYRTMPEGKACAGRSLPVAAKSYVPGGGRSVVCYHGRHFGVFAFVEFLDLYASLPRQIQGFLRPALAKI
jgi:hypothetical protein